MILNHKVAEHKQNQLQAITGVDLKKLKQLQWRCEERAG